MDKDLKLMFKTPALRRKEESNSSRTSQSTESVCDGRQRKRKIAEDETPRKSTRVSEVAGPSTTCQEQLRTVRRQKRKMTQEGEGSSPPAKRKKRGFLEQVLTKELPPSSEDISTESSSSCLIDCSTQTGDLRKRNLKRKAEDLQEPPRRKTTKKTEAEEEVDFQRAIFQTKYIEVHQLGEGGFGTVFAGYRGNDKLPVAIKHIPKDNVFLKHKDENGRKLALEVAIMLKLRNVTSSLGQSAMVSLLDWYDLGQELILVMERPVPAEDLLAYLNERGGSLKEKEAKIIIKQLVEAGIRLQDASIFHRDIKVENILIETSSEVPRVCLIDFGLSCFDHKRKLSLFRGTRDHIPPEFHRHGKYSAGPTTVWQLGVVLFELLHKKMFETTSFLKEKLKIRQRLSRNCKDFLVNCLVKVPEERPNLEDLLCHPWFS